MNIVPVRVARVHHPLGQRCAGEAAGTFILVLLGPGAAVTDRAYAHGMLGPVGVALAFFFALLAGISAFGARSGAHFNPAVTLGLCSVRRFASRDVLPYVASQCVGAVAAAFLIRSYAAGHIAAAATVPGIPTASAFAVELVFSAILMGVILAVAANERVPPILAALAVAGTVGGLALQGALTGASMNPARSLGPALASGVWSAHWLYWFAPITGMIGIAWLHLLIAGEGRGTVPSGVPLGVEGPLDTAAPRPQDGRTPAVGAKQPVIS